MAAFKFIASIPFKYAWHVKSDFTWANIQYH